MASLSAQAPYAQRELPLQGSPALGKSFGQVPLAAGEQTQRSDAQKSGQVGQPQTLPSVG
jgi:hypothetical protein